jgi:hypothetical protein
MSRALSPSFARCYGLARVARVWKISRASVYRFARRPNVRLIVLGNEPVMQSGSDLGYRTDTGDLRMSP